MPSTGQLGTADSQLGNIVFGGVNRSPFPFGFTPHVLDSMTIRVLFDEPVTQSALNPAAYSMLAVSGPVPTYVPTVISVTFYDADQKSVALVVNNSLTFSAVYALSIVGVTSLLGNGVIPNAANFRANVPNGPIALGAYLSMRGMIDIYFDRPVGLTSPGATATIQASSSGTPQSLTLIPWNNSLLPNIVRFELNPTMDSASSYIISFSNIIDVSNNQSAGQIPLTLTLQAPTPYDYSTLSFPQIIDAWVNSVSNATSGYDQTTINVFFNCPMWIHDITNISNWVVTQNGNPVTVLSVINWCSVFNNRVFSAIDAETYFAQVVISATSPNRSYNISVTARSEDRAYTTNPSNYTGNINVSALATSPRVIGNLTTISNTSVRFNQEIYLPSSTSITGPTGSVSTTSTIVSSSPQALVLMINDLMESYNQHITVPYGAGHVVPDLTNYFLPVEFSGPTVNAAITAVNRFRDLYFDHASSTLYHNYADPNLVMAPYAVDVPSAIELAQLLINSFVQHNANVGVHNFAGIQLFSSKLCDVLSVNLSMNNDATYNISASSQYFFINAGNSASPLRFSFSSSFIGVATSPYVASAIPQTGIVNTGGELRLQQDAVIVFFSKSIQQVDLAPTDISITGPTNILTQGFEWMNDRVLSIGIINMATAQYALDIFGVQDKQGNQIVSAP
jgi:hypothetical protein